MKWLSDWLGWEEKDCYALDDEGAWDFWMEEVEPRIRENGLWEEYIEAIFQVVDDALYQGPFVKYNLENEAWAATLEQRAEALRRVLE